MANVAVVNGIGLTPVALRPLAGGPSSVARVLETARGLPGVSEVVLLASQSLPGAAGARTVVRDDWTVAEMLAALASCGEGREDLFLLQADSPLADGVIAARMHETHRRYFAEYTFADGWPVGITGEILRVDVLARLAALAAEAVTAVDRQSVFSVIQKDINAFDIETELAPKDLRMLRASLTADQERNAMVVEELIRRGAAGSGEQIIAALEADPGMLRTLPAFFAIQVTDGCPQSCAYCPWPVVAGDPRGKRAAMPVDRFSALLDRIGDFARDAVVSVSLWGEPGLHPDIEPLVGEAARRDGIRLLIETSGIGWPPGSFQRLAGLPAGRQPTWIVSLDAATEPVYRALRGEGFAEATAAAVELLGRFPRRTHVQAVRMQDNEEDLEAFWKSWRQRTEGVIVQKYDHCCGLLPQRRVADLTPVTRMPCFHLRRDFAVLLDGTVPLCREDLRRSAVLGNAFDEDLAAIWRRGEEPWRRHLAGDLPELCTACDEYYTWNF
jgi:spiro-SPASM protein